MKKTLTFLAFCLLFGGFSFAQQDAMFTKYMFNSLIFNPGYAGSRDYMYVGLLHRTQWAGIDGAPETQSFTVHTPLKNDRVGVGLSVVNDKIGPSNSFGANLAYAYRIPFGQGPDALKLSIGIQGGIENFRADWTQLNLPPGTVDPTYDLSPNTWNPNFGAGLFLYNRRMYIGVSSPHLIEYELNPQNQNQTAFYSREYRHYYFTGGVALNLKGDDLIFKPSFLIKNVGLDKRFSKDVNFRDVGAPTEFDIDLSLLFYETFWIGTSFRSAFAAFDTVEGGDQPLSSYDSADVWFSWFLSNGLRIGAAYDFVLNDLRTQTSGSFELMLGYEFNYRTKAAATPRYF